jgi:hypothetical protein
VIRRASEAGAISDRDLDPLMSWTRVPHTSHPVNTAVVSGHELVGGRAHLEHPEAGQTQ